MGYISMEKIIPLTCITPGKPARIVALHGGITFQRRLRSMGLREGSVISVVTAQPLRGPLVISLGRQYITIGRGMAERILVRPMA